MAMPALRECLLRAVQAAPRGWTITAGQALDQFARTWQDELGLSRAQAEQAMRGVLVKAHRCGGGGLRGCVRARAPAAGSL